MHEYELIRKAIDSIDGGTFQALAQRCCFREYGFRSANYYGTKTGSVKTVAGHPDAFYETNVGNWAFLEAGHIADRTQAIQKIKDDIQTCLEYEKRNPEMGALGSIICCYSCSRFNPTDINLLKQIDSRVILVGPDDIAEMCITYPWLAHEYLGTETSSTTICDLDYFIAITEKDAFAPSLKLDLAGRDQEIEELLQIISGNQAVCLVGKSGSGKTKLAIEACARYSTSENAVILVMRPSHKSVYKALEQCCRPYRQYLILLDDANDLANLRLIREYASLHGNIKLIATTRNYAKQYVVEEMRHIRKFKEYPVSPIANDIIENVLENQLNIRNQNYVQQIIRIAHGNMRLAILAAEAAKADGFQSITSIYDLLETCYEKKLKEFSPEEKLAAAISSILGAHITESNSSLDALELKTSISHAQYMEACKSLHQKELLDMIQGYAAISFEEQNLRDYFIQQAIVEDRAIELRDIYTLSDGERLVARTLNVILNVFYSESSKDYLVIQLLRIWNEDNGIDRLAFVKRFGSLIPLEALAFLANMIQSTDFNTERVDYLTVGLDPKHHYQFKSDILECATVLLDNHEYWQETVDLILSLLERDNGYVEDFCHIFDSLLKPDPSFLRASITRERYVLNRLKSLHDSTTDATYAVLLLRYARTILCDEIEGVKPGEDNQFIFYNGRLQYTDELMKLRSDCIRALFSLRKTPSFENLADSIAFSYRGLSNSESPSLAAETCKLILANYHLLEIPNQYCCLQAIWDFRRSNQKALLEFGWIDNLLDANPTTKLISFLKELKWRFKDSADELRSEFLKLIAPMTEQDWRSFLDLLQNDESGSARADYHIPRVLIWAIEHYENRDIQSQKLLVDHYFSLGITPRHDSDSIFSSLASSHPSADLRQVIIGKASHETVASWLTRYDSYALAKNNDYSKFTSNVLGGLNEYGELIDFASVMQADLEQPGFLGDYCKALTESAEIQPEGLAYHLPSADGDDVSLLDASLNNNDNLAQFEKYYCFNLEHNVACYFDEKLLLLLVEKDPAFVKDFLLTWVKRNAEIDTSCDQSIGELYWKFPNPIDTLSTFPEIQKELPSNYSSEHSLKRALASIVKTGIKEGYRTILIDWLSSEVTAQSPFSEIATDVGSSLEYENRAVFCIALCEKDVPVDAFTNAAISIPFDGISWTGSEIPLIDERIEYENNLAKLLTAKGHSKYCLKLNKHLYYLRTQRAAIEIREFTDPF